MKVCTGCKEKLSEDQFHKKSANRNVLAARCRTCTTRYKMEWRRLHPEQTISQRKRWDLANLHYKKEWNRRNPERHAATLRRHYEKKKYQKYGIDAAEFDRMLASQEGKCVICRDLLSFENRRLHVDHDHATGIVRGLLCRECNLGLGAFRDNPKALAAAIRYLKRGG